MCYVSKATEKKINEMVKNEGYYSNTLLYLLGEMKSQIGWNGGTIAQIEKTGEHIENSNQFDVRLTPKLHGISIDYNKYINTVGTLNLHYVTIRDFNGLVNICYKEVI